MTAESKDRKSTYSHLLRDKRWQQKRLNIFNRDEWTCRRCADPLDNTLHIHHLYYKLDFMPWEYPDEALITLCSLCHEKAHFMEWVIRHGIVTLQKLGFPRDDIYEIKELVFRNLSKNGHHESAQRYMADIKLLMNG